MKATLKALIFLTIAVGTGLMSTILRPAPVTTNISSAIDLDAMVPVAFGGWSLVQTPVRAVIDPAARQNADRVYSQVLNRTYRNTQTGSVIMLSIAINRAQTKQEQAHRPEICYPAQGFEIGRIEQKHLSISDGHIPTSRLVAQQNTRVEPVTYWIRIGDRLASGWLGQKTAGVLHRMSGAQSGGLLFRVSSIGEDIDAEFVAQEEFIIDLLRAVPDYDRAFFIGRS